MPDFDFLEDTERTPLRMCFDRLLPPDRRQEAARLAIAENPANRPRLATGGPAEAAAVTGKRWAQGRTLRIKFLAGDPVVQDRVRKWANVWTEYINLKFEWVAPDQPADIRIDASYAPEDGSWSYIGTDARAIPVDEPTMRLGWLKPDSPEDEVSSVVLHEFGHGALGLIHEHQSPAASIKWNRPRVYKIMGGPPNNWDKQTVDVNMFDLLAADQTQYTRMDPRSIMMYPIEADLTLDGFSVGWNTTLSPTDIAFARQQYPREVAPPPVPPPPPAPPPPVDPVPAATELTVNARPALRRLSAAGGKDVFRFRTDRAGAYTIAATRVTGQSTYTVELHGGVYPNAGAISRPGSLTYRLVAGTWYVAIRATDGRSVGQYAVSIRRQGR